MLTILLTSLALFYLCIFFVSIKRVVGSGDKFEFIYPWGFLVGAFIWEDVLVFAPLFFLITLVVLVSRDIRVGFLFVAIFWLVRSAGETLYFFLEQFLVPKYQPHNIRRHLVVMQEILRGVNFQKTYIIMQVFYQTVCALSIACIIWLLANWQAITPWVN